MMKVLQNTIYLRLIAVLVALAAASSAAGQSVRTIVIDPGHGGKDPGAPVGRVYEKDIVLDIALDLGRMIKEEYPDIKVVYTRSTDVFVELGERGNIANRADADLFLSIHVNAAETPAARGTETLVLGVGKSEDNLAVAMRENSVIRLEENYTTKYQGFDPDDPDSYIIFNLMQFANRAQSIRFAEAIQRNYTATARLGSRGVKQSELLVLLRTSMPGVLTEVGFITNETERKFLTSKEGKQKIARSLLDAVGNYISATNGKPAAAQPPAPAPAPAPVQTPVQTPVQAPVQAPVQVPATPPAKQPVQGAQYYAVQVASATGKMPKNSARFGAYRGTVEERVIDGRYKYFVGRCETYAQAQELLKQVRTSVPDAFVVRLDEQ